MNDNRRKFSRYNSPQEQCVITYAGGKIEGSVVNESIDGLRIEIAAVDDLKTGEPLEVCYNGETTVAYLRNLARLERGRFAIGLERNDLPDTVKQNGKCLQDFVSLGKRRVACTVTDNDGQTATDDQRITVELFDGKQFVVAKSDVAKLTTSERLDELGVGDATEQAALFYSLIDPNELLPDVDSVLSYEFRVRNK